MAGHPCWEVQKALDQAGIDYEVVKEPLLRPQRKEYEQLAGTRLLPAIEFEDGSILRTATGRHLGNFPQAFSHLALIEASARIVLAERLEEFSA
jgi:hypothetical protein